MKKNITHRSGETSLNSLFSGFTWERKEAAKTNWPTVLKKLSIVKELMHNVLLKKKKTEYLPRQECIIGEVGYQDTICELHNARKHQEEQERINEFKTIWRVVVVGFP